MRNRIRILAMAVVAAGGAVLATPTPAEATYKPPPPQACCCMMVDGRCVTKCCFAIGCTVNADGCRMGTT